MEAPIALAAALALLITLICAIAAALEDPAERAARLRKEYEEKRIRLEEEADIKRAEIAVIQAQTHHDLVLSRVRFLRSLSKKERGLLEARLRASAEADAKARYQLDCLEEQNRMLTQQLAALTWDGRR